MKAKACCIAAVAASLSCLSAARTWAQGCEIAKFDPRMAVEYAVSDTNGFSWIDGRYLPLEGKAYANTSLFYDRLPSNVTEKVNAGVRHHMHNSAGMQFRFRTDSDTLHFKWIPLKEGLAMDHMPSTGVSGIDVYRQTKEGRWFYVKTGRIHDAKKGGSLKIPWTPGTPCLVNLPLYNGVKSFLLGIKNGSTIEALGPRKSGIDKPVVFYGTSITHGGCASRPGLAFPSIVGRDLDVPIVNLGFSGSGVMELEMSEHLAAIDASCYVLDCLWNMSLREKDRPGRAVETNYEPFIRNLRAKRPGVPIVMAEACDVYFKGSRKGMGVYIRKLYEKLVAEGWKNLVFLPDDKMYTGDGEGTVDGTHPNDWGMMSMAKAFESAVAEALGMAR